MSDNVLCPVCHHPKRRHKPAYGCTAGDGQCECGETQSAIDVYHDVMEHGSAGAPAPTPEDLEFDLDEEPAVRPLVDLDLLFKRAEDAGGRYARQATRIQVMLSELRESLEAAEEVLAAERQVAELRRQLNQATVKLRNARPGTVLRVRGTGNPSSKEVRAWAAEAGVDCAPLGRISGPVMEAYYAAHPEVSGAI